MGRSFRTRTALWASAMAHGALGSAPHAATPGRSAHAQQSTHAIRPRGTRTSARKLAGRVPPQGKKGGARAGKRGVRCAVILVGGGAPRTCVAKCDSPRASGHSSFAHNPPPPHPPPVLTSHRACKPDTPPPRHHVGKHCAAGLRWSGRGLGGSPGRHVTGRQRAAQPHIPPGPHPTTAHVVQDTPPCASRTC